MGKHITTVVPAGTGYQGRCVCRQASAVTPMYDKAALWGLDHVQKVETTRRRLERRGMTLAKARDYYWEKANDETESDEDRLWWQQLAQELDRRVGPVDMAGQDPLF